MSNRGDPGQESFDTLASRLGEGEILLQAFEQAWRAGTPPRLDAYLPPTSGPEALPPGARHELLEELVKIDLEYRWRGLADPPGLSDRPTLPGDGGPPTASDLALRPLLENYVLHCPALGPLDGLSCALVGEEYRVRHHWGDRPGHAEYAHRFPRHGPELLGLLTRIDAELRAYAEAPGTDPVSVTGRPNLTLPAGPGGLAPAVDGYEILGELGRGGMGVVYKARQKGLNRLVAVKMILGAQHASPEVLARFRAEAEVIARLQHPNVVQVHAVGEQDGRPYFALELLDGGSLNRQLAGTPLPARPAAQLVETLARAVHAAHERGVIHRDLKPANVLLARSDPQHGIPLGSPPGEAACYVPKITDFGLAKLVGGDAGQTQTGAVLGTPSYMAPEQAHGDHAQVGPASDVYALGAILYECLTGRPPFRTATALDTLELVRTADPVPPRRLQPGLPRDLETVCLKCLRKAPGQRYASARDLADDLRRFRNGEPIHARPVGAGERVLKWVRRHPAAATAAAVSIASIVVLFGGGLLSNAALRQANRETQERADEAEHERAAALAEWRRAEDNFQLALDAVERMLTRVAEGPLAAVPQAEPVRRSLLEDARAFYEAFLRQKQQDSKLRAETARAYARLARVNLLLGQTRPAEEAYEQAVGRLEALAAEAPADAVYRYELAECYVNRGTLRRDTRGMAEAEKDYVRARDLEARLLADFPDEPRYQTALALTYSNLGIVYRNTQRFREAEGAYRKALGLQEPLAAALPNDGPRQRAVGLTQNNLGNLYWSLGRLPEAETAFRAAVGRQKPLVERFPSDPTYLEDLANAQANLGGLLQTRGQPSAAEEEYRQAVAALTRLVADFPAMPRYRQNLGRSYFNLGTLLESTAPAEAEKGYRRSLELRERLVRDAPERFDFASDLALTENNLAVVLRERGELTEAVRLAQAAVEHQRQALQKNPRHPRYPFFLGEHYQVLSETLLRQGEHAAAAAAADELVRLAPTDGTRAYQAARVQARCARLAEQDPRLGPEARRQQAERYAGRAVELLRQALARGAAKRDEVAKDADFDALRGRLDYDALLRSGGP
jgi:tetratricopeptide (TPR) repeat protein